MKTRFVLIAIAFTIFSMHLFAQATPDSSQLAAYSALQTAYPTLAIHWSERTGTPDIITLSKTIAFSTDPKTSAQLFLDQIAALLKQDVSTDKLEFESLRESRNTSYSRFQQTYKGVPIKGGEYVVTVLPGGVLGRILQRHPTRCHT